MENPNDPPGPAPADAAADATTETAAEAKKPGLRELAESLTGPMGRVNMLLTLVLLGVPGVLWKVVDGTGAPLLWQTVVLTAPMTIAVAIIAYLVLTDKTPGLYGVAGIIIGAAAFTWVVGLNSGGQVASAFSSYDAHCTSYDIGGYASNICSSTTYTPYPWYEIPFRLIGLYWQLYGPREFLAAGIVGAFLAWLWVRRISKLIPRSASAAR
jgi:hypothetical protein